MDREGKMDECPLVVVCGYVGIYAYLMLYSTAVGLKSYIIAKNQRKSSGKCQSVKYCSTTVRYLTLPFQPIRLPTTNAISQITALITRHQKDRS